MYVFYRKICVASQRRGSWWTWTVAIEPQCYSWRMVSIISVLHISFMHLSCVFAHHSYIPVCNVLHISFMHLCIYLASLPTIHTSQSAMYYIYPLCIYAFILRLCPPFIHPSLQSIANGFRVYKGERLHDIGFVDASLQAVFTNAASLNSWRLRAVIHILLTLQCIQYAVCTCNWPYYCEVHTIVPATSNINVFVLDLLLSNLVIHLVNSCPETSWDTILIPFLTQMCCVTFTVGYTSNEPFSLIANPHSLSPCQQKLKASWDKITQKPSHVSNEEPSLWVQLLFWLPLSW